VAPSFTTFSNSSVSRQPSAPQHAASVANASRCSCTLDEDADRDLDVEHDRADGPLTDRRALPPDSLDLLSELAKETDLTRRETLSILGFVGSGEDEPRPRVSRWAIFGRDTPPRSSVARAFCGRSFTIS